MGVRCLIYQPPYSILNRGVESAGILDWLHDEGIGCIAFSPLAQGMLTPKYLNGIPADSRAARPEGFLQSDQVHHHLDQIQALGQLAVQHHTELHHLAIQWTLQHPAVTSALVGARNVAQLDQIIDSLKAPTSTQELLQAINEICPM
jgi:L-glyceraldehyde 3-phosphate reductase